MKKKLLFSLLFLSGTLGLHAQSLVLDPALVTTITVSHIEQQNTLGDIKDSENKISAFQILIQQEMNKINKLQEKTYNYLSTVNAVVKNGKDIIYASTIAKDIAKYQSQSADIAKGDPELLLVVAKTEYELISRSADLMLHIYNVALADGEKNLLDNKQRIDLCIHVVNELRRMRGTAYTVLRQLKSAKRNGLLKSLTPGTFRYVNNCDRKVDQILKDLKFIGKGGKY